MKKLLIVVDMQNDFVTGTLGSPAAREVVEPIRKKAEWYLNNGHGLLFTMDTHPQSEIDAGETREAISIPPHCIENTEGWQIVDRLRPLSQDRAVTKPTFLSTGLAGYIRERCGSEVEVELCGVCTDICVVSNALNLRGEFPSARILVDGACCAGTTPENHRAALAVMKSCLIEVNE